MQSKCNYANELEDVQWNRFCGIVNVSLVFVHIEIIQLKTSTRYAAIVIDRVQNMRCMHLLFAIEYSN